MNYKKGQKEARIGLDNEKDIVNLINTAERFRNLIKNSLSVLGFEMQGEIKARKNGTKTDIFIENGCKIGVSIKSITKASFHSLDRRRLQNWKDHLNMPNEIFEILKDSILHIAQDPKSIFINLENREKVKNFFTIHLKEIIYEIFTKGEDYLKLLLIDDARNERKHKIYLFRMDEVVCFLSKNASDGIIFSSKGIMYMGNFISMQRKSGDGSHIIIPKTNWEHPGNQIQFKFSPLEFAESIEKNKNIKVCIFELLLGANNESR